MGQLWICVLRNPPPSLAARPIIGVILSSITRVHPPASAALKSLLTGVRSPCTSPAAAISNRGSIMRWSGFTEYGFRHGCRHLFLMARRGWKPYMFRWLGRGWIPWLTLAIA